MEAARSEAGLGRGQVGSARSGADTEVTCSLGLSVRPPVGPPVHPADWAGGRGGLWRNSAGRGRDTGPPAHIDLNREVRFLPTDDSQLVCAYVAIYTLIINVANVL